MEAEKVNYNIEKSDRINRTVIGVILILGALLGLGKWFFILAGLVLIAEGILGWCGIPILIAKFQRSKEK